MKKKIILKANKEECKKIIQEIFLDPATKQFNRLGYSYAISLDKGELIFSQWGKGNYSPDMLKETLIMILNKLDFTKFGFKQGEINKTDFSISMVDIND